MPEWCAGMPRVAPYARYVGSLARVAMLVLAGLAFGCGSGASGSGATATGTRRVLPDGVRVPAGTQLIGRVVPDLTSYITGTDSADVQRAWTANLAVDGSASAVYSRIRAQAAEAGLPGLPPASTACSASADPGPTGMGTRSGGRLTTCGGSGGPGTIAGVGGPVIRVEVARCERCRPETGVGRITYEAGPGTRAPGRVKKLVDAQTVGPSDPRAWLRLPETTVLRSGWYYSCQQNQLVALAVTGKPSKVWRTALDNSLTVRGVASTKVAGREVRQAVTFDGSDTQQVTMDLGARPMICPTFGQP